MASDKVSDYSRPRQPNLFCHVNVIVLIFVPILATALPPSRPTGGFRRADNYFTPPATGSTDPESKERLENCEEVVKNGMLCKMCAEPATNAKYEQCSYVSHPGMDFDGSDNVKPKIKPEGKPKPARRDDSRRREDSEEDSENVSGEFSPGFFIGDTGDERQDRSEYISESERLAKDADNDCEEVEKDGMICKVCKNSKTGGNFETCSFAYQPKEKVYKYSKSKSYGFPKKDDLRRQKKLEKSQAQTNRRDSDGNTYDTDPTASHHARERDSRHNCHEVLRDSMTCEICEDPETKENSEQCWYSYKPDDKMYAYTKSSSFSTPKKTSKKDKN